MIYKNVSHKNENRFFKSYPVYISSRHRRSKRAIHRSHGRDLSDALKHIMYEPIAYHPIPYLFLANGITRRISYHLFILTPHVTFVIFYILHCPSLRSDILSTYILYPILVVSLHLLCYRTFHTISLHVLTSPVCGSPSANRLLHHLREFLIPRSHYT